jgi:DNA-binding transcriptional regulator YdaS (Cro superfamily)
VAFVTASQTYLLRDKFICAIVSRMGSKSALERAIQKAGSQTALARLIGRKQQNVAYWLKAAKGVPAEVASAIEAATDHSVTKEQLRPDIFGDASQ